LSAEFYLETIRVVFQEHALPKGTWLIENERVDPSLIENVNLLTIEES